ncbi:MAG: BspA family leucine-rich repeat surface protein, partial [Oscillospiraceae bacterium]|nr:BspA family leucine-rich repeat surface protein [Oscillospiraceae bacterium]
ELVSVGNTENALHMLAGTIENNTLDNTIYQLTTPVVLKHDRPWELEWKCSEDWRGVVLSSGPVQKTEGMCYLSRTNGGQLCFGTWTGTQYDNFGVDLSYLDAQTHTYLLENRISSDGENMACLYVDGVEIGPMNNHYIGSNDQGKSSDWLSGKDFMFPYIGMEGHALRNCRLDYLRITECVHAYENGICTVCGAEHPNLVNCQGKVISIMGDSISTFAGYIPTADGFNREHLSRYPQDNLLTDVNETWWMQVIDQLDAKLGINDSWRGSTLSGAAPVSTGDTGENAAMSNLTRIQNLGSNGTPDVILLYGGTNDLAHVSKVGSFDPATAPTEADLTTKKWDNLAAGFVHTLLRMKHYYPDAEIVAMLPTYTKSYYSNEKLAQGNEVMAQICEHYGIPYVDLRDSGVTANQLPDGIHPGEEGMDLITEAVIEALLSQCEMEKGENTVYSVTHKLENVKASLGHYKGISAGAAFTETLEGDNLNVSVLMNGRDITSDSYADGIIHIAEVSGPLLITAEGNFSLGERLQQLPEGYQGENLWPLLRHDPDYYTADGWGVHSSGAVKSVTIPVTPGDRLVAASFGAAGSNGGSLNGIRVSFFGADGLLIAMASDKVYREYSENGYLTVPDEATAVCIPMWKEQGAELYLIPSEMELKDFSYMLDEENRTVTLTKYTGTQKTVSVLPKYIVGDKIYSTVLDSASVFRGNSAISSVKIHSGVSFKEESMAYLFSECKNLLSVDMSGVDTSSVTDMSYLFDWCSKLSSILGYENWDTGSVVNIYKMFNRTSALTKIDLSDWDLSQVINSGWCFQMCMASEILLPDNLKTISAGFLNHATQYEGTSFTIPSGVKKIGYAHTIYDFATNDFVEFKVAEGNTLYSARDGILYSADGSEMLAIPRNKTFENGIYEIPEGVSFLGELSFSRNYNINTLVIPNSLEIRYVPLYDPEYIVFEDVGNLNAGNSLSIAIYSYTGITDYAAKEDNPNYASVDGIIYTKDMSTVVAVPSRYNKHMNIPEGVTTWLTEALWVGDSTTVDNLMANCSGISIPSSLTNIADDQIAKLNKLKGMFETFEIEVSTDNPVYCTDENGFLILRDNGLKGDLDLDGSVNSEDLTLLARHVAGIELLTGIAMNNGDVNGDGMISADDLTKHARYVAGIITNWDQE